MRRKKIPQVPAVFKAVGSLLRSFAQLQKSQMGTYLEGVKFKDELTQFEKDVLEETGQAYIPEEKY